MNISEVRSIIDSANWSRTDLSGSTREEFKKQRVDLRLYPHICALEALLPTIKPRFARDIKDCQNEIEYCKKVMARWNTAQEESK